MRVKESLMASIIRVLHLIDLINRYDLIDNVLRYCDRERFQLYACTFTGESTLQTPTYTDVPRFILKVKGRVSYPRALARLTAVLFRERIDIVHTHDFDTTVLGVVAAGMSRCRVVVGRHYSDLVHRIANPWKRGFYLHAESLLYRSATRIIVPSATVYDLLTQTQGVDRQKVVRIPYGFDMAKFATSEDGPLRLRRQFAPDGQILVGCVGRLSWEKGQMYLLQAARALIPVYPALRILFIGDGPDKRKLELTAKELGLVDHVIFTGWRKDVVDLLAAVDVVVQPSLSEAFCRAMVEAMILGKPLVMSNVSGAPDVIDHGKNGLLVPPGDSGAIANALGILLSSPDFARQLGEFAHRRVAQELDIRHIIRQYEECYLSAYAGSRAA
jgi:glycosyltransferase involved in cell wall biosynthesis